ncbi:MAG: restriction endonuclease subunit R [Flavobacteriaceae bacterium]|nr:restriction endonuclease subunit R [Flavobacteriaceae bacterium]|tara:strand:- start:11728 stop:12171 length:444 start_codon:yes stop_codon:yes gene_type:complete
MFNLTFPKYEFRLKKIEEKRFIFDEIRKKYIEFTPEEWVRQNCVKFLIDQKKYFSHLISIEKTIKLNGLTKRFDIIAYDIFGNVDLLVECKAPNIIIDQKSFDQIITYDKVINAKYLMLTNGIINYYCEVNKIDKKINFLKDIPVYK